MAPTLASLGHGHPAKWPRRHWRPSLLIILGEYGNFPLYSAEHYEQLCFGIRHRHSRPTTLSIRQACANISARTAMAGSGSAAWRWSVRSISASIKATPAPKSAPRHIEARRCAEETNAAFTAHARCGVPIKDIVRRTQVTAASSSARSSVARERMCSGFGRTRWMRICPYCTSSWARVAAMGPRSGG